MFLIYAFCLIIVPVVFVLSLAQSLYVTHSCHRCGYLGRGDGRPCPGCGAWRWDKI